MNSDRLTVDFTMMNGDSEIMCSASWELMDDLERSARVPDHERHDQFKRQKGKLEEIVERKFFSYSDENRPNEILITNDEMNLIPR